MGYFHRLFCALRDVSEAHPEVSIKRICNPQLEIKNLHYFMIRDALSKHPEQRVAARHQRDRGDGRLGHQVPAHHVAEGLVQAHAVHVDRQALRAAQQRRRAVAAVVHVGLEGVVLHLVDVHAAQAAVHEAAEVDGVAALDLRRVRGLRVAGHAVLGHVEPGQRRHADDDHRGVGRLLAVRRLALGPGGRHGQRECQHQRQGSEWRAADHGNSSCSACGGSGERRASCRPARGLPKGNIPALHGHQGKHGDARNSAAARRDRLSPKRDGGPGPHPGRAGFAQGTSLALTDDSTSSTACPPPPSTPPAPRLRTGCA